MELLTLLLPPPLQLLLVGDRLVVRGRRLGGGGLRCTRISKVTLPAGMPESVRGTVSSAGGGGRWRFDDEEEAEAAVSRARMLKTAKPSTFSWWWPWRRLVSHRHSAACSLQQQAGRQAGPEGGREGGA